MGQYFLIVNRTKKQYLHPHRFGEGMKLLEFGCSSMGSMAALAVLLSDTTERLFKSPLEGSWAGDSIVISGDYAEEGKFLEEGREDTLFVVAKAEYEDISEAAIKMLLEDRYLAHDLKHFPPGTGHRAGEG